MKKLKRFYKNRRLGQKILINYILIIFVTIVSLSAIVTSVSAKYINDNIEKSTYQLLDQINSNIEFQIGSIERIINYISIDNDVQNFCSNKEYRSQNIKNMLNQHESVNDEIAGIMIISGNGGFISESMVKDSRDSLLKEDWVKLCYNNLDAFHLLSKPLGRNISYKDKSYSADNVVSICKAIIDEEGRYVGTALVDLKLEAFEQIIEDTKIGTGGFVFIQNDDNDIIYSPINDVVYRINPFWLTSESSLGIVNINNVDYKVMWKDSEKTNWKIVGVFSSEEMFSHITQIIVAVSLISLAVILFSLIISSILSNSITRPLAKLERLMEKSEDGELDVKFDIESNDEIGRLGNSFNKMIDSINQLIDMVYEEQHKKREAELEIFRSQIKPHFLYNTLDTIHWLIKEKRDSEALMALRALTNLFRISLSKGADVIRLQDEIKHVESYLIIQKLRYSEKLSYNIDCPEQLLLNNVSKITLQPIVENAIYHGIKEKRGQGNILISVRMVNEDLFFLVEDDGKGIEKDKLERLKKVLNREIEPTNEYGLINVNERIKLEYGEEYGVDIESAYGVGTKVYIKHPIL